MVKLNRKIISWSFYDFANSAFATTVMAGFFPVFLKSYWGQNLDVVQSTDYLGSTISYTSLVVALLSPILGIIADLRGYKKLFCFLFMIIGSLACFCLGLLGPGDWAWALTFYSLGFFCFTASCVFYDSLLPGVAKGLELDLASSFGYAMGYLGGGLLFLLNVIMYLKPELFGIQNGVEAVKLSFMSVALWWVGFSLPLFFGVSEDKVEKVRESFLTLLRKTLKQLQDTFLEILKNKNLATYMLAYWLFIDGVYTVMTMAVDFGMSIGLQSQDLISALLITQFVGFPSAWAFGYVTKKFGSRKPIILCLVVYSITVIGATQMREAWHFYSLATVVGLFQGGVQSLSRSLFAHMIPAHKSGEYFAFFNLVGKFASILGPLIVAKGTLLSGDPRVGLLGLLILFFSGILLLMKCELPKSS